MARTLRQQLEQDYLDAPAAAQALDLDKSWLCVQLRAGKFPGAFQWGSAGGGKIWIIPRVAVDAYRETHLDTDRRPQKKKAAIGATERAEEASI